jgi:arylsulfatase A-like enzyme
LTISLDLMPTMLDLAGVSSPKDRPLDGVSLVNLLLEGEPVGRRRLYWEGKAMRDWPWKLVLEAPGPTDPPGLFYLGKDLAERNNVSDAHPKRVKRMTKAIKAWRKEMRQTATEQPSPSEEFLRKAKKRLKNQ